MSDRDMKSNLDRVLSILLVVAALAMAASLVRREFGAPKAPVEAKTSPPIYLEGWRQLVRRGVEVGPATSDVKILTFNDLECPGCRQFHQAVLTDILSTFTGKVSQVFIHFPLSYHRFATQAAVAAQCADRQGAFGPFVDLVFAQQDSIGLKPWAQFAIASGTKDTVQFGKCTQDPSVLELVKAGRALADSLDLRKTPTVIVNGWLFSDPPSGKELARVIAHFIAGREPFSERK